MIYISIGSNLGNRLLNIKKALNLLKSCDFRLLKQSIIFETQVILPPNADKAWNKSYLNMVVQGKSTLTPSKLLIELKKIEKQLGRADSYDKWSPRVIDLDILLWSNCHIDLPDLKIPHPELLNRPFLIHLIAGLSLECRYTCPTNNFYNNKTFAEIAHLIENQGVIRSLVLNPQFVGILNITPDSFSDGGLNFHKEDAVRNFVRLINEGATIIELGSQSTRPSALIINEDEEYARLENVLEELREVIKEKEVIVSIDSFTPEVIKNVLKKYPISCINLVKNNLDNYTLRLIADYNCKIITMHSLAVPPQKQKCLDFDNSPLASLNIWAEQEITKLEKYGFDRKNIILDPGIGFGKSVYQNLYILQHMKKFKNLGCEILVGHSRKSYISAFYNSKASERDLETIAISKYLTEHGADYLRVHNVIEHQRFFVTDHMLNFHLMKNRKIIGIMACDPQGVIGNKGQMPWSYTKEFEYFYQTVKNNIIVMGRKTFDSIPAKILKNCICIVFSRNTPLQSYNNRTLRKLAYREEFEGDTERRTAAYTSVREDSSTGSTYKLPLEVEFPKSSIIFFIKSLDDFWRVIKPFTDKKIFMVGGAEIATLFLEQNLIDEFLLTKINKNYDGDAFFPIDFLAGWHSVIIDKTNNYQIYKFIK